MQLLNKFQYYVGFAAVYSVVRKAFQLNDAHFERFESDKRGIVTEKTPLLITDKLIVLAGTAALSPGLLPFYILKDAKSLEIKCRNLNHDHYYTAPRKYIAFDWVFD